MTKRMPGVSQAYEDITMEIRDLYRELNTGDDDRAEKTMFGIQIRLRRTRINCEVRHHLEYNGSWGWSETTVLKLTEYLHARRSA